MFGGGVARTDQYQDTERERESMVWVTDNSGPTRCNDASKDGRHGRKLTCAGIHRCSKHDSILSYPRWVS